MPRFFLICGALAAGLAVALGAFGAHGLKSLVTESQIESFEVGIRYQMYHALLLMFVGLAGFLSIKTKKTLFYLVLVGIVFFSGSIYGLATNDYTAFDFKSIALITPIGGLLLIISWLVLLIDIIKGKIN